MRSRGWRRRSCRRSTAPTATWSGLPLAETLALLAGRGLAAPMTHAHRAGGDRLRHPCGRAGRRPPDRGPRQRPRRSAVTDALFAARVTSVDTKLNAAFLDCGLPRPALLVAKDARAAAGSAERRPIRELVHEGQRLLVQGVREPVERQRCAGHQRHQAVRLRARSHAVRAACRRFASNRGGGRASRCASGPQPLFPDGRFRPSPARGGLGGGRCCAPRPHCSPRWRRLEAAAKARKPGRLPEAESPLERLLRGLIELAPGSIAAADRALAAGAGAAAGDVADRCRHRP